MDYRGHQDNVDEKAEKTKFAQSAGATGFTAKLTIPIAQPIGRKRYKVIQPRSIKTMGEGLESFMRPSRSCSKEYSKGRILTVFY